MTFLKRFSKPRPALVFGTLAVLLLAMILLAADQRTSQGVPADTLRLSQAEALPMDLAFSELDGHTSDWQTVELPLHWRNAFSDVRAVWYRFELSREELQSVTDSNPDSLLGLYLWRLNQTADFWLNGQMIGSGGSSDEPMARYWNTPLYFSISPGLIAERNTLLIKHYSQHSWGSIEAPLLGAEEQLKPVYEHRYFIQHDVALGLFVFVIVTGSFCLAVWIYRPGETQYFWFAVASGALSFYCLNQFIRYLPISPDLWRWLTNISIDLWVCASVIFIHRSLKLDRPRMEKVILAFLLCGIPVYFYASYFQVFDLNIYFHFGAVAFGIYGLISSAQHFLETESRLSGFYCAVLLIAVAAGLHDNLMQAAVNNAWPIAIENGFQGHFNLVHFAAPLIFLLIGASLIRGFIDSMNVADQLNEELELRVEEARQELDANYQAIEEVLVRQSAMDERERIYRDLHDDVGSKLLSLYYRLDKQSDSALAKSALEDLRDIVSSKSLESCSLSQAVQQWQLEASDRLSDSATDLSWQNEGEMEDIILDEIQLAHLRRMLREVLSNALLHSDQLSAIRVAVSQQNDLLSISVSNDGSRAPVSEWTAGRGIGNLRVRARDLGGKFDLCDLGNGWVRAFWSVPINSSPADASQPGSSS